MAEFPPDRHIPGGWQVAGILQVVKGMPLGVMGLRLQPVLKSHPSG